MNRETDFKSKVDHITMNKDFAQDLLWIVQLEEYPDSVRVQVHHVITKWCSCAMPETFSKRKWDYYEERNLRFGDDSNSPESRREIAGFVALDWNREIQMVLKGVALTLQYDVCIYYECGLQEDGTYKYKGCRYGVDGGQYQSGFGEY